MRFSGNVVESESGAGWSVVFCAMRTFRFQLGGRPPPESTFKLSVQNSCCSSTLDVVSFALSLAGQFTNSTMNMTFIVLISKSPI